MKKLLFVCAFLCLGFGLFGQNSESQVLSYRRNFARANLNTKYELVKEASKNANKESASFFLSALTFVDSVYELLENDNTLMQIGIISVETLARLKESEAILPIRLLFIRVRDVAFEEACVRAFKAFDLSDEKLIADLNLKFEELFYKSVSGQVYSKPLLLAYIDSLGAIGNKQTFSLLFNALIKSSDENITNSCKRALPKIPVNFFDELVNIIEKKELYSTSVAFEIALESTNISEIELAEITDKSMSVAIDSLNTQKSLSKKVLDKALKLLTEKRWQTATDLVVSYFYKVQASYRAGFASAGDFATVIDCMAVLGSKECANALVVFLGLLNSDTERGKAYNEEIVFATVKALGELGDSNAFDYLVYVDYLNYPEKIKKLARESIAKLRW